MLLHWSHGLLLVNHLRCLSLLNRPLLLIVFEALGKILLKSILFVGASRLQIILYFEGLLGWSRFFEHISQALFDVKAHLFGHLLRSGSVHLIVVRSKGPNICRDDLSLIPNILNPSLVGLRRLQTDWIILALWLPQIAICGSSHVSTHLLLTFEVFYILFSQGRF